MRGTITHMSEGDIARLLSYLENERNEAPLFTREVVNIFTATLPPQRIQDAILPRLAKHSSADLPSRVLEIPES